MAMTLYDFLKLVKADFDTYDTVFDTEVTVCCPMEFFINSKEKDTENKWYDTFYDFILKHVEFVVKTGECSCVVNWYKFINDNIETFRECANEMWKKEWIYKYDGEPDDNDLTWEWINEINGWLAGYVSESEYKNFMEKYAPRLKEV